MKISDIAREALVKLSGVTVWLTLAPGIRLKELCVIEDQGGLGLASLDCLTCRKRVLSGSKKAFNIFDLTLSVMALFLLLPTCQ